MNSQQSIFNKEDKLSNLSDTQLQCNIYVKLNESQSIDDLHTHLNTFTNELTRNYIWNNEKFCLQKRPRFSGGFFIYENLFDFGECVEDEWYIVYILTELTKAFYGQKYNVIAQVYDADEDFILIHLANHLPKWASSAEDGCMKNRVYIYNGLLHIIKPATKPSEITYLPSTGFLHQKTTQIVRCIVDFEHLTCASDELQANFHKRLNLFRNYEKSLLHQTTCSLPAKLVWLLDQSDIHQNCLSVAINRFADRDANDLKLCRNLSLFKPDDQNNPLIDYRVRFTKYLYSKLKHVNHKTNGLYKDWSLIADKHDKVYMGLKLTCAFEILAKLESQNYKNTKAYKTYLDNLKQNGYFKDLLDGSLDYKQLVDEADRTYLEQFADAVGTHDEYTKRLNEALGRIPSNYVELLRNGVIAKQASLEDDNDDWLNVDPSHFDDYMDAYSTGQVNSTYDFDVLTNAFKKFFQDKELDYKPINTTDKQLIDFDIDSIENSLHEILMKTSGHVRDDGDDDECGNEGDSFYEINGDSLSDDIDDVNHDNEDKNLKEYIKSMDCELQCQKGLSRLHTSDPYEHEDSEGNDDLELNLNLVSNAIESYSSQFGLSGPVSNILKSLGI
jgi:hypothetical protein